MKPAENVIFLKTHKTGSSTVTNVMQRFAKSHRLNVALPKCDHRFCYPHKFEERFLDRHYANKKYNMLFSHAVFHKENMLEIMATNNTKIVTIIREPYSQYDSAAQYFNYRKFYKLKNDTPVLDAFFEHSDDELRKIVQSFNPLNDSGGAYSLAKNPNAFDMGFDVWNETPEYIKNVLDSIRRDFHLVMIMEYMEESFILLKNELCWKLEDVIFYVHNARKNKVESTAHSQRVRERVLAWNKLDAAIYSHFNQTFWQKVRNSNAKFDIDVKKLKELNKSVSERCSTANKGNSLAFSMIHRNRNEPWNNANKCADILANEIEFTNWFRLYSSIGFNVKWQQKWF